MAYDLNTVTNSDQSTFDALSPSGQMSMGTDGNGDAIPILTGVGWMYVEGNQPRGKTSNSEGHSTASELLIQTFAASGSNPSKTRYFLVSSTGTTNVSLSDSSASATLNQGQYVDVMNTEPPSLGAVHTYSPVTMPQTRNTLQLAQSQYQQIKDT